MLTQFYRPILAISIALFFTLNAGISRAQAKFDSKLLKGGKYTLACYTLDNGNETDIGTFSFHIQVSAG